MKPGIVVSGLRLSGAEGLCTLLDRHPQSFVAPEEPRWFDPPGVSRETLESEDPRSVVRNQLLPGSPSIAEAVAPELALWYRSRPDARPVDAFHKGMSLACDQTSSDFWVARSTVALAEADRILAALSGVQMAYVLRHPCDLVAAVYSDSSPESSSPDWLCSVLLGWKRALGRVRDLHREFPDRVHRLRWEDLPGADDQLAALMRGPGMGVDPAPLTPAGGDAIPSPGTGGTGSGDEEVLSGAQRAAVWSLLDRATVEQFYPGTYGSAPSMADRVGGWLLQVRSLAVCLYRLLRNGIHGAPRGEDRFRRRMRLILPG